MPQPHSLTLLHSGLKVLILAEKGFEWLSEKHDMQGFINKIDTATSSSKNSHNPVSGLWYATDLEPLKGIKHLCSTRVQEQHRVIMITRYIDNRLVIVFIKDDPGHKYPTKEIQASYRSRGHECGDKEHWKQISQWIDQNILKQEAALDPKITKQKPSKLYIAPTFEELDDVAEYKEETQTTVHLATAVPEPTLKDDPDDVEDIQTQSENKDEPQVVQKKKKKKKKKLALTDAEKISTEDIYEMINIFIKKASLNTEVLATIFIADRARLATGILEQLLDLGLNPNTRTIDKADSSLLEIAGRFDNISALNLLWERGARLQSKDDIVPCILFKFGRHIDTINWFIKKIKENGTLNLLIDMNGKGRCFETLLHNAVYFENPGAVKALCEQGADWTIKDSNGQTPLEMAEKRLTEKSAYPTSFKNLQSIRDTLKSKLELSLKQAEVKETQNVREQHSFKDLRFKFLSKNSETRDVYKKIKKDIRFFANANDADKVYQALNRAAEHYHTHNKKPSESEFLDYKKEDMLSIREASGSSLKINN